MWPRKKAAAHLPKCCFHGCLPITSAMSVIHPIKKIHTISITLSNHLGVFYILLLHLGVYGIRTRKHNYSRGWFIRFTIFIWFVGFDIDWLDLWLFIGGWPLKGCFRWSEYVSWLLLPSPRRVFNFGSSAIIWPSANQISIGDDLKFGGYVDCPSFYAIDGIGSSTTNNRSLVFVSPILIRLMSLPFHVCWANFLPP